VPLVGTIIWSEKCTEWTTLCLVFKKNLLKKSPEQLLLQGLESILMAWIQKAVNRHAIINRTTLLLQKHKKGSPQIENFISQGQFLISTHTWRIQTSTYEIQTAGTCNLKKFKMKQNFQNIILYHISKTLDLKS
jgi:hypothetical protein